MIRNFKCKQTQSLHEGGKPKQFRSFQAQAERKLQMLDNAVELLDLRSPPGNMLEKLAVIDWGNTASELTSSGVFALFGRMNQLRLKSQITTERSNR